MRSKLVSRPHLNKLSQKLGIDKLIKAEQENGNIYRSINGDAFEALIGAIYLDKGYRFSRKIIVERIIGCHVDMEQLESKELNYKSTLIELAQKEKKQLDFKVVDETGKGYRRQYVVEVIYDGKATAKGFGFTIKEAEQNGAEIAYNALTPSDAPGTDGSKVI